MFRSPRSVTVGLSVVGIDGAMAAAPLPRRDLRRIILGALVAAALIVGGALGLLAWAAGAVDDLQAAQERALVDRGLDRALGRLSEDVASASIWDDTVRATAGPVDLDWLDANLGDYYADYLDHQATLLFAADGRLIRAWRESEVWTAAEDSALAQAVAPLVDQVRREAASPARRRAIGFEGVTTRTAVVRAGAESYLVAASTVVPDTDSVPRPAAEAVVVSVKPMSAFLVALADGLLIRSPRFVGEAAGDGVVTVGGLNGAPLGAIAWSPARPGLGLLGRAAPLMVMLLVVLAAAGFLLFGWVDAVARQLGDKEAALAEARDRAETANVAKSRFLANMSHELRTPLNGVLGMAEVMDAGELSEIQRRHLGLLKASGGDLLRMIEHLLHVTRLEREETRLELAPFDLAALVAAVAADNRARAEARGLTLTVEVPAALPWIGDAARLREVLTQLVDNALTFTGQGAVALHAGIEGEAAVIHVSDTGPGIPPELRDHIFEPFVQGDDSATRRFEGAGVGLAICRKLVEAMGGAIAVDSSDRGATFTVTLPPPGAAGLTGTSPAAAPARQAA